MRFGLTAIVPVAGQPDKHQAVSLPFFPRAAPSEAVAPSGTGAASVLPTSVVQ
jgi:hypothetical protein